MRLADLLPEYSIPQSHADLSIFGVTDDSREVRFGFVFCALPLASGDSLRFCAQAAARGAQVVIVPDGTSGNALGLTDFEKSKVAILHHPKIQTLYAKLVARFPARSLRLCFCPASGGGDTRCTQGRNNSCS